MTGSRHPAPALSGCVIVRDEAPLLDGCLASLRPAVTELVVVDHGSRDDSAARAARHGARLVRASGRLREPQRNRYLEAARSPWVLVLDADERLDPRGIPALSRALNGAPPRVGGLLLRRFDWLGRRRWAEISLVRLFRRDRQRYFWTPGHSSITPSLYRAGRRLADGPLQIHHLDALRPGAQAAKRARRRATLRAARQGRRHPVLGCYLALELAAEGRLDAARRLLIRTTLRYPPCRSLGWLLLAQLHLAAARAGERGAARRAERVARRIFALDREGRRSVGALRILAACAATAHRPDEVRTLCRAALERDPASPASCLNLAWWSAPAERTALVQRALRLQPAIAAEWTAQPGAELHPLRWQDALLPQVDVEELLSCRP